MKQSTVLLASKRALERVLGRVLSDLRYADLDSLLAGDFNGFLSGLLARCNQVSRAVQQQYALAT